MTVGELRLENIEELKKQFSESDAGRELLERENIDQLKKWLEYMNPSMDVQEFVRWVHYAYSAPWPQSQAEEQPVVWTPELRALADEIRRSFREEDR